MRTLLISFLAAILGVVAAWGATKYEFRVPERPVPVLEESRVGEPKVVVEEDETYNFPPMQLGQTGTHVFTLRNDGTAPLVLTAGTPSCKCTVGEISGGPALPGEKREITVSWTPKAIEDKFRQSVPIHTNDLNRPTVELRIGGKVLEPFKIEPNPVPLGQFSPTETNVYTVNVWGFVEEPWKLKDFTFSDEYSAPYFDVEARDMTAEEIARQSGALSGQVLKIVIKPGVSLGHVQQKLLAHHNDEPRTIELPLIGKAVGDITVFGASYSTERELVDLKDVPRQQGKKTNVTLIVKGPHREQVKLKLKSVDPATSLQAAFGEPTTGSKSVSWPLTIEVPPGAEPVNRTGSESGRLARIEFETGTADVPQFALKVRFSVTGDE